jgi:aspartate/methionine/tyrosine aminotransferase
MPSNGSQSSRLAAVQSPVIPIVGEWIRQHPGTISLGQGVVHYGPPPQVHGRIAEFFRDPENHKYQAVHGIPPLVDGFERKLKSEQGVDVAPDRRIVVTAGGNMAFANAVFAIADPGDEVILLSPYYFNHEMAVTIAGCKPVVVPTDPHTYQPRVDAIRAAITPRRTRAVVTISPNNPTGVVYPESTLREINAICNEHGVYHIHDEAYEYFTWPGAAKLFSPATIDGAQRHTICLYSLSKSYGFASWRIGAMLIPAGLFEAVRKIQDTILICAPVVSQYAALGCLVDAGPGYCREHLASIGSVREVVLEQLASLGDRIEVAPAGGAFYAFLRIRGTMRSSMDVVETLIRDHGVAVIPGSTFGVNEQKDGCTLRVSYGALRRESVIEGMGRLARGLRAIAQT